jgi:hypothetical protein
MPTRFAEVFGAGHVVKIIGGKLDGQLVPLKLFTRRGSPVTPITPESLETAKFLDLNYDPNQEAMEAMAKGEEGVGPGERLFTSALFHFVGYEEWGGLTVPKLSLLGENDMNIGIRGGVIPASGFVLLTSIQNVPPLTMTENVLTFMPHFRDLMEQYQANWPNYTEAVAKTGTVLGYPFELNLETVGSSAGVGTVSSNSTKDITVFLLLSGKSKGDESNAVALAQKKAALIPHNPQIWTQVAALPRPLLLLLSETGIVLQDPVLPLAWVFFRRLGAL